MRAARSLVRAIPDGRPGQRLHIAAVAVAGLLVAACGGSGPTVRPSAEPTAPPSAESTPLSQEEVAAWIRFRLAYGLRADVAWVVEVARDPKADQGVFDVPLMPAEVEQVFELASDAEALAPLVERHGRGLPGFGGVWLELPRVGIGFTEGVAERRAEVADLFGERVFVREVRFTLAQLEDFAEMLEAERDWFANVGVQLTNTDVVKEANQVLLWIREGPYPLAEQQIREHFDDTGWLAFRYQRPPPWAGPLGDLQVTVVDAQGRPVPVYCLILAHDPRVMQEEFLFVEDGKCFFEGLPAVEWKLRVDDELRSVQVYGTFVVRPDRVERGTLVLGEP